MLKMKCIVFVFKWIHVKRIKNLHCLFFNDWHRSWEHQLSVRDTTRNNRNTKNSFVYLKSFSDLREMICELFLDIANCLWVRIISLIWNVLVVMWWSCFFNREPIGKKKSGKSFDCVFELKNVVLRPELGVFGVFCCFPASHYEWKAPTVHLQQPAQWDCLHLVATVFNAGKQ